MKQVTCSFLLSLLFCSAAAREKGLYVVPAAEIGFTLSHYTSNKVGGYYGLYTRPSVRFNYMFNNYVGITSGLGYEYFSYDIVQNTYGTTHYYTLYNQHVNYLEMPLLVHWELGRTKIRNGWFWMDFGADFNILLGAKYNIEKIDPNSNNSTMKGAKGSNSADMSGIVVSGATGMGWGFSPGRNTDIIFGLDFKQSVSRSQKEKHPVIPEEANGLFAASLKFGLQFYIGRK